MPKWIIHSDNDLIVNDDELSSWIHDNGNENEIYRWFISGKDIEQICEKYDIEELS